MYRATFGATTIELETFTDACNFHVGFRVLESGFEIHQSTYLKTRAAVDRAARAFVRAKKSLGYRLKKAGPAKLDAFLKQAEGETLIRFEPRGRVFLSGEENASFLAPVHPIEVLAALLASPRAAELRELRLGKIRYPSWSGERNFTVYLQTIARHGPPLRKLALVGYSYEDLEDSYGSSIVRAGGVTEMLAALPELRELTLEATFLQPFELDHPKLEKLTFETGAFHKCIAGPLARARLPRLKTLAIAFGDSGNFSKVRWHSRWRGEARLFEPDRFPELRVLRLVDNDHGDEIVEDIVAHALPEKLETLDLSESSLTDAGAQRIVAHRSVFTSLKRILLKGTRVSPQGKKKLQDALGERVRVTHAPKSSSNE